MERFKLLRWILKNQLEIRRDLQEIKKTMATKATKADLDSATARITDAIQKIGTDLQTTLANIQAKIDAGAPIGDITDDVAAMNAGADKLTGFDATVVAADPGPQPTPAPVESGNA